MPPFPLIWGSADLFVIEGATDKTTQFCSRAQAHAIIDNHSMKPAAYCDAGGFNTLIKKGFLLVKKRQKRINQPCLSPGALHGGDIALQQDVGCAIEIDECAACAPYGLSRGRA